MIRNEKAATVLTRVDFVMKGNASNNDGLIYVGEESIPFTGRMFDTLDNKMMVEFDVVNGLKNGEFFLFSPSGKLKAYGFIENNKKVGTWEYYMKMVN